MLSIVIIRFSAIARSVMISATQIPRSVFDRSQFQCYSS